MFEEKKSFCNYRFGLTCISFVHKKANSYKLCTQKSKQSSPLSNLATIC